MTGDQQSSSNTQYLHRQLDLDFALQAAELGVWEYDVVSGTVHWDDRCRALFGIIKHQNTPYEYAIQHIHEEDRPRVDQAVQRAISPLSDGRYDQTYRTIGIEDGQLRWVRFQGRANFTADNQLQRFAGVAQDVTQQIVDKQAIETSRQQLVEAEHRLRTIITHLPSATVVFRGRELIVETPSQNFIDIIDRGPNVEGEPLGKLMPELESQSFLAILDNVFTTGQSFRAFGTPVAIQQEDGSTTNDFFDLIYTPLFDSQGQTYAILSVATNVTDVIVAHNLLEESEARYRLLSTQLEQQIEERTGQLSASNEALAANNEALAEANSLLVRSNDNLQTFAYVASHDLQEPLRKIQQFGDLLKTRFVESVGEDEIAYIERMQVAASRMSMLIKDLLDFSRITTQRNQEGVVQLGAVVDDVLSTLDITIAETGAQIQVDALPDVSGDAVQFRQLFQNLLGNALKFRRSDVLPHIRISSQVLATDDLPPTVKPTRRTADYCLITVADNGIGFDEKYLDRIFQVFQRLHGRSQYAGTGVGLAICEKVVTNHGGVITATSQPDQGATFMIYLPAIS